MPLELHRIVRAEDFHFAAVLVPQFAQPVLVPAPCLAVLVHHELVEAQSRRAMRRFEIHFAAVKVRIARLQQPAAAGVDRNAGVTERVPNRGMSAMPGSSSTGRTALKPNHVSPSPG